ncbi:response regulator [Salinispirillum sp. LH 10-3-1]|uniref:Response regulator n=1 Tax=Salinispirillum sp. LH 10-3-1 TaxID=2952525 RepID=A0AB38YCA1_9GAMM
MAVGKATLLVIDDDASVRESLAGYLEDSGYDVLQAADGVAGLEVFYADQPDLVLCDLRMPRKDGLAVLQEVVDRRPDVPFIVVSGAGVMSDVVSALRFGASDYIVKPVTDLAVVEHAIDKALERVRLLHENNTYRETLEDTNQRLQDTIETLEADLRAGRHVQQSMLPPKPFQAHGLNADYELHPSLFLSGDFVDYFELQPGVLLHYIVDVAGHGVSSAMVTILIRNEVIRLKNEWRYKVSQHIAHPAEVLAHLNQELLRSKIGKHATLFIGILDSLNQTYCYANAAHFPYPILKVDGAVKALELPSSALGLFPNARYEEFTLNYDSEFAVAMCSDGLLEINTDQPLADREQAWMELVSACDFSVPAICAQLRLQDIEESPDDMTILSVTHWNRLRKDNV